MNNLIKMTTERGVAYTTSPVQRTDEVIALYEDFAAKCDTDIFCEVFSVGKMPLSELPEDIQVEVRSTLKAYARCNVTYEHGAFHASASYCIKSSYGFDHFVCGEYKASEVYTLEERRANYLESFGCAPCF